MWFEISSIPFKSLRILREYRQALTTVSQLLETERYWLGVTLLLFPKKKRALRKLHYKLLNSMEEGKMLK